MTASAHSSVTTKVLSIDHTFPIFSFFFSLLLLIIVIREVYSEKGIKMILFTFSNSLFKNLPTHIRENTNFLRQKPRQLPCAEANFEDYITNIS